MIAEESVCISVLRSYSSRLVTAIGQSHPPYIQYPLRVNVYIRLHELRTKLMRQPATKLATLQTELLRTYDCKLYAAVRRFITTAGSPSADMQQCIITQ